MNRWDWDEKSSRRMAGEMSSTAPEIFLPVLVGTEA